LLKLKQAIIDFENSKANMAAAIGVDE